MERLLHNASPLGLYAEELDAATGRHLGNFPQAFSHLALIEAAARIIVAERIGGVRAMSHYDVIVIGSGAGGGTLVHRLAPSGKQVLLLERGDWLPREPQNWSAADVFVDNRYVSRDTWYDEHGKPFQPQIHYFVGGATKLYGAALYRLREEDFGELDHHDGSSPAWPVGYDEFEPYYTQAEQLYQVHGARGEDPTEPHASAPYPYPAVSHEPRIQQLSDDLAAAGLHPFHAPCGVMLDEARHAATAAACAARRATASRAWCTRSPTPRCWRSGRRWRIANVTLLTGTRALRLETNAAGTAVTGVVVERDGAQETFTADIVVVSCGAANSAALLLASATPRTRTGSPTGPTRSGATTCSTTARPCSRCPRSRTRRSSRRRSGSTTSTSARTTSSTRWGTSRWSASPRPTCTAARSRCRPSSRRSWTLDEVARHALDFWLSTEDLPRAENRVTLRGDGSIQLAYAPTNQVPKQRLLARAQDAARAHRGARAPPDPAPRVPQERDPGRRRGAPGRDVPVRPATRRRRCSTPTAARTRSTTSTSSTRASSRASARSTRR